jgi:hypothetical protein
MPAVAAYVADLVSMYIADAALANAVYLMSEALAPEAAQNFNDPEASQPLKCVMSDIKIGTGGHPAGLIGRGYVPDAVMVGPLIAAGHCMAAAGLDDDHVAIFNPAMQPIDGDVVLLNGSSPPARFAQQFGTFTRVFSVKFLRHLDGRWWAHATDGTAPVQISAGLSVVGVLAAALRLKPGSVTARFAKAQSERIEALVDQEERARLQKIARKAIEELETLKGSATGRPYPNKTYWPPGALQRLGLPMTKWRGLF